ncbi:sodium:proton antiporter [Suttonella sp. R2A3]|uniref:cation:proton antiporter n=1 Tax=Suttonella sp. R2A3 TaxID=2908648 RepID=UPI001F3FD71F|nr:sodium:proton antiporter [Suttonella sp. R2A3]UJF23927.1 sodium:proton antiporter [Suttonella sp. R2A3]
MLNEPALMLSSLLALGIAAQWLGWSTKKPAIIYLLLMGIILGPTLQLFNPDEVLGEWLFPLISLGVAIILFEGALTLNFQEIKSHGRVVTNLVTVGVLITIAIATVAALWIMDMSFGLALLFGALVCVTGPTVIVPLLRSVRPNKNISNILRWEGVVIDPIGALLVVLVYEYIIAGHSPLIFAKTIVLGLLLGSLSAYVLAQLLRKHWVPKYLHNVFTLALVLLIFALSNALIEESGLLTVTVMGMALANMKNVPTDDILDFKESLSIIIISMLFIILAARINFDGFQLMGWKGVLILLIIMFVARPLSVWVSALGSNLSTNEKLLISWIAPRGIVAAAVSSLFVLKLGEIDGHDVLVPLVFTIIIGTVMVQSLTAKPLANWLKVADPNPNGVLISGINPFSLLLGKAIKENGFDVMLASSSYDQTAKARMEGMSVYYGDLVSEHADRHLSLVGYGHLLALHQRDEQNMLATLRYRSEFGHHRVYRIKVSSRRNDNQRNNTYQEWDSAWLFSPEYTYSELTMMVSGGAQTRSTNISESYGFDQLLAENPKAVMLFAISPTKKIHLFSSQANFKLDKGWKVIFMLPFSKEKEVEKIAKRQEKNGRRRAEDTQTNKDNS